MAKKFYGALEVGKVYRITNVGVKQTTWKQFGKYEIWARKDSIFQLVEDQELEVLEEALEVTPLSSLTEEQKQPVNVVGVVRRVSDVVPIKNTNTRELEIVDDSGKACLITIWGSGSATEFHRGDIVSVTKTTVSSFLGLSLSASSFSKITVNPADNDTAVHLADWLDSDQIDIDSFPLVGKEKRRKIEKLADIAKTGSARVTIKTVFIDRKMTFNSKKTGATEMVLKIMVEDDTGHRTVSG